MRSTAFLAVYGLLQSAATVSANCNANNCLRAVRASAFTTRHGTADCSSYFLATVTQITTTSTLTVSQTASTTVKVITETIFPTAIPTYASACSGSVEYSSACSCLNVTHSTTTITPTSVAPPTCPTGKLSCNGGPCQDVLSDPNNCGKCGNVCSSGVCQNGQCSAPVCDGSTCGSLNGCGSSCFCFESAGGTGFCGPNVPCSPLPSCSTNADCSQGEVCATSTCCARNVCLGPCSPTVRKSLLLSRNFTEAYTGGLGPDF